MAPSKHSFTAPWTRPRRIKLALSLVVLAQLLAACAAPQPPPTPAIETEQVVATPIPGQTTPTAFPTRPAYLPGELVDYTAQTGDTLPALAFRFNTTIAKIRQANPILPQDVTTMPPGMPMKIPIFYQPLWGSQFHILPDSRFPWGPADRDFDPVAFVNSQPGWFKNEVGFSEGETLHGGEIVVRIAKNFSVSPRLLLALVEYQTGGITHADSNSAGQASPLGFDDPMHEGMYRELTMAANMLNNIYYGWREGKIKEWSLLDGRIERPDPWQNAATVALQYYFSRILQPDTYFQAIGPQGFIQTYTALYGDPWANPEISIPGSLTQPDFKLPFSTGAAWAFTGGPHTGWGTGEPLAALDFAPPANVSGCIPTDQWATAVADGVIVRTDLAVAVLDLDGDGDERTGWVVFYLHLATGSVPPVGTHLKTGDPIGHPSCEGGEATGTHVHIARKYNGEWVPASGALAFNLEGWVASAGAITYEGDLVRYGRTVKACTCSDKNSQIQSGNPQ